MAQDKGFSCRVESLSEKFSSAFSALRGKGRISESDIDSVAEEIRLALLDGDVALSVVEQFVARVKERSIQALPE
ncbi:MAG: signal recognition particle receptor subunit alpha, partial [bacterium]